ncbi:hypothetical protein MPNT_120073 [Candidatus Methylacidithermus pantelleriae]|uniref:Uncharacterized protein n=1 Tax=Candidatus Methylacidithermus pantelleriae TaxID=2744239 RepID=A0A8J2BN92_9BACT|nr:hypothetical protein MPNT_120073 [Candidatus Methylacidithermus pantelleriae]
MANGSQARVVPERLAFGGLGAPARLVERCESTKDWVAFRICCDHFRRFFLARLRSAT